jgi:RNA polymerase sigma factor (sigma-70 family)
MVKLEMNLNEITSKLYNYCLSMTGSKWLAEDIVQETLIKYLKIKQYEPNREIQITFLYKVAKNLLIDEKRKKTPLLVESDERMEGYSDFVEWDALLEILYGTLPIRQAMLITLKDVFQYTSEEIAQMLRVSNESVKTTLHRARRNLQGDFLDTRLKEHPENKNLISNFTKAVKTSQPHKIFYYYRLLETENYRIRVNRLKDSHTFYLSDPDGNLLQIESE